MIGNLFQHTAEVHNRKNDREKINLLYMNLPSGAIDLINSRKKPFDTYLVDMRIPEELKYSEKLFYEVQKKFSLENFYFITGHESPHDIKVLKRTHAQCILKPFCICDIFKNIIEGNKLDDIFTY